LEQYISIYIFSKLMFSCVTSINIIYFTMSPKVKLLLITSILSWSGSWHFGFELTCINPTQKIFEQFLNDTHAKNYGHLMADSEIETLWSWLVNLPSFGAILGTIFSTKLFETLGRRRSFFVGVILNSIGQIFSGISYALNRWEVFAAGRFFSGNIFM